MSYRTRILIADGLLSFLIGWTASAWISYVFRGDAGPADLYVGLTCTGLHVACHMIGGLK